MFFESWLSCSTGFSDRRIARRRHHCVSYATSPRDLCRQSTERLEDRCLLTTIDLATLTAAQGSTILGADADDQSGISVSSAGDVNGDGFDDLLIGAFTAAAAANAKISAGESYVIFGGASLPATVDLASLGASGLTIHGVDPGDRSGGDVSSAGDVNGDGFDDLLIGAASTSAAGNSKLGAGESYVIFGGASLPTTIDLASLGPDGFTIYGADVGDSNGFSLSRAGDVNGDGFDDLLIGASIADAAGNAKDRAGDSYVIFGGDSLPATIDLANLGSAGLTIHGIDIDDYSGTSVSGAGDVNGDGFDDLLIGAAGGDAAGNNKGFAGESYVIFGGDSLPATIDLASPNTTGITIYGSDAGDRSGTSVSSAGDVNGDGFDDLLIGARFADAAGNAKSAAGESYVVFGGGSLPASIDLASLGIAGLTIYGADASDYSGISVSGAGDVNGDGFDDLLIGAYRADAVGNAKAGAGESYVIFGSGSLPATVDLANLGADGLTIYGVDAGDDSGRSVSSGGDVNGDGFDDLLIGARIADGAGNTKETAGESYLIFGGDFTSSVTHTGTSAAETLTGDAVANVIIGGRSDDILIGNGGPDVLRGGEGDDVLAISDLSFGRLVGGTGTDTLRMDGNGQTLDLTTIANNRIVDVEEINLGSDAANTLILTALEVRNLSSDSNTLSVRGSGSLVRITDDGWSTAVEVDLSGTPFRQYRNGSAVVNVQTTLKTQFAAVSLSSLDGSNGFHIDGTDAGDYSGDSVSSAGDVNGDGFDDLIIGARDGDYEANQSYVVFGKSSGFTNAVDLGTLDGSNGFRIDLFEGSGYYGPSVSSAGDVNGDGFDDIIIGAPYDVDAENAGPGQSYVMFGKSVGFTSVVDLDTLDGSNGFRLDGIDAGDYSGHSVSRAGDVNGDGFDDLIIGAKYANPGGESYVVFGKSSGFTSAVNLGTLDGNNGFRLDGIDARDDSGVSVSSAGDVNGDGCDDLIIGAHRAAPGGDSGAGESYVVFGKSAGFNSAVDLGTLDGSNGFRLDGIDEDDRSGVSVSSAGDVNGDGFDDLIIGAYYADPRGDSDAGESYVVFGKSAGFTSAVDLGTLDGSNGFRIDGIDADDESGLSVSGAGDVNGDGFDDIIIGARFADPGGERFAGESYVMFGKSSGFTNALDLSTLDGSTGFRLDGIDEDDYSGDSVSSAGDVNGDGFDDLIIGAINGDPDGNINAGESYVVFGGNFTGGAETQVGDTTANMLTAAQGAAVLDILIGGLGDDILISDGGPDVLAGGHGNDILAIVDADFSSTRRLVGGSGTDILRLDGSGQSLDLTAISDNRIVDVEEIDIRGTGANTLTLDVQEVLNISSHSNTLTVRRSGDDTVNIGTGWTQQSDEVSDGVTFEVFIQGAATIKIQKDVTVTIAVAPAAAAEDGADNLVYTLTRDVITGPLTVGFTVGGQAVLDSDYTQTGAATFTEAAGTVTFADGQATATLTIDPISDATAETAETVILTLSDGEGSYLTGTPSSATGTITDDDTATFTIDDVSVNEADGTATFTVSLDTPLDTGVLIDVSYATGTAGTADFDETTDTVTFEAGSTTAQTVTVAIANDDVVESAETFIASLAVNAATAVGGHTVVVSDTATGTISDNDIATFTIEDVNVSEADGTAIFRVSLDNPLDIPVMIDVNYATGTAGAADFDDATDTVTFAAGSTTAQTVTVAITDDGIVERTEIFTAALAVNSATAMSTRTLVVSDTAIGTITDNDTASFTINDVAVDEADGTSAFTVSLDNPLDVEVMIDVSYAAGTAEAADFDSATDTVTFAAGTTAAQTVSVAITDDDIVEATETFTASLAINSSTDVGTRTVNVSDTAIGTITDNDVAGGPGNVDGDTDFDASDSFLIHLAKLSGTDGQIDQSKGPSALTAAEIRSAIDQLQSAADVDGDGDFDASDSFLIHLVKLSGTNAQIDQSKGASSLTAAQIRTNVDSLGGSIGGSSSRQAVIFESEQDDLFADSELGEPAFVDTGDQSAERVAQHPDPVGGYRSWIDAL